MVKEIHFVVGFVTEVVNAVSRGRLPTSHI